MDARQGDRAARALRGGVGATPSRVFGRNRVSTYLLVGLGEDPDELVAGAEALIDWASTRSSCPTARSWARSRTRDGVPAPDPATLLSVTDARRRARCATAGMRGADQGAGCAACGACSALQAAGG